MVTNKDVPEAETGLGERLQTDTDHEAVVSGTHAAGEQRHSPHDS